MDFGLSQEQTMLQETLARFLKENAGLARTRAFAAAGGTRAPDVLAGLANLGVAGILIDEEHGGVGLSLLDAALAAELLGYHVTAAPFIGSSVLAPLALQRAGSVAQRTTWLPRLAAGTTTAGVALTEVTGARLDAGVEQRNGRLHGKALFVIDFAADIYVVADRARQLYLVAADAPGLTHQRLATVDVSRITGELGFADTPAEPLPGGGDGRTLQALLDAGRVMLAADTLGAAQNMLDQAVAYALTREQFGRAIASFQAVKHMCAEMAAALEPCRAVVWYAAHALATLPDEAAVTACHAKAHLAEVGTKVARTATEVHGGMGFTDLVGLHYWFKRIGLNRQLLGGPQATRAEAARLQGLAH